MPTPMLEKALNAWSSPDRFQRAKDFAFSRAFYALPDAVRQKIYAGERFYCPVCESQLRSFMVLHRPNQVFCPVCRSVQRHRLVMLFFRRQTDLFDGQPKRLLHVAPEPSLAPRLSNIPGVDYLSADLHDPAAMVRMDITRIQYDQGTFDTLYCSHVLEHVPEDRQALSEFFRVLKPGGWALILVPIRGDKTYEDPSITSPQDRERAFGQFDHVRFYGMDFRDRLADAGFEVEVLQPSDIEPHEAHRMAISCGQVFFFCRKPVQAKKDQPSPASCEVHITPAGRQVPHPSRLRSASPRPMPAGATGRRETAAP